MLEDGRNTRKPPWLSRSLSVVVNRPDALAPCRYKDSRLGVSAAYDFLAKDSAGVAQTLAFGIVCTPVHALSIGPLLLMLAFDVAGAAALVATCWLCGAVLAHLVLSSNAPWKTWTEVPDADAHRTRRMAPEMTPARAKQYGSDKTPPPITALMVPTMALLETLVLMALSHQYVSAGTPNQWASKSRLTLHLFSIP